MASITWKPAAVADLLSIITYIAQDNPTAAQTLKDEVENKANRLLDHPQIGRKGRVPGTRELVIRPNYILVHTDDAQDIIILRLLHTAQRWPHNAP